MLKFPTTTFPNAKNKKYIIEWYLYMIAMSNTFCRARGIASLLEDLTLLFWLDFFFLFYLSSFVSLIHTHFVLGQKHILSLSCFRNKNGRFGSRSVLHHGEGAFMLGTPSKLSRSSSSSLLNKKIRLKKSIAKCLPFLGVIATLVFISEYEFRDAENTTRKDDGGGGSSFGSSSFHRGQQYSGGLRSEGSTFGYNYGGVQYSSAKSSQSGVISSGVDDDDTGRAEDQHERLLGESGNDDTYDDGRKETKKMNPYSLVATIDDDDDSDDDSDDSSSSGGNTSNSNSNDSRKCGKHGAYSGKLNKCLCSVLYEGTNCDRVKPMPLEFKDIDCLKAFTGEFEGDLAINRDRVLKDKQVAVTLPGKEKDPDGGYRVLVPNEEPLFSQFAKILPKKDEIGRAFFGTCAVVGSSGIVLNYDHGSDIDEHDMVFRFNSAPTRGFEKHVGSKTTYRITNTQNWGFHEPKTDESILIHFRAKSAIKGLFWNSKQKKPLKLYAFAPDFVEYVAQKVNFLATSGLYGILLALQRCHSVSVYGFQVSTQHGALYHYYDPCDVPANVERDDTEWIVIRELARNGFITFAEPCVAECHETKDACDACKEENNFKKVKLPSRAKCDPNAVSKGHQEVPWRAERRQGRRRGATGGRARALSLLLL